ncbi:MAG: hypothetical protein IT210_15655 [Armatimonadetes bacterium]|nr:hypothetical protein [Armatimonadota bacterium]
MKVKAHFPFIILFVIINFQLGIAHASLSLSLKSSSIKQILLEIRKQSGPIFRATPDISREKVHIFGSDSLDNIIEKICVLRGYEIRTNSKGERLLSESASYHRLKREKRTEARALRTRRLKEQWRTIQWAYQQKNRNAVYRRDRAIAQHMDNVTWQGKLALLSILSPQQWNNLLGGQELSFQVSDLSREQQDLFMQGLGGGGTLSDAQGNVLWSSETLREKGFMQFIHGGPPERPTLYLRYFTGGSQWVAPWHSVDMLRPREVGAEAVKNERGKDDKQLQKHVTISHLTDRRDASSRKAAYGVSFPELLQRLAEQSGLSIVATCHRDLVPYGPPEQRQRPVYLRKPIKDEPVWKALNILSDTYHYTWERQGTWVLLVKKHWYLFDD